MKKNFSSDLLGKTSGSSDAIGWIFCLGVRLEHINSQGNLLKKNFFVGSHPPKNPSVSSDDFIRPKVQLTFTKGISVLCAIMSVSLPILPPPVEEDGFAVPAAGTWKGCKRALKKNKADTSWMSSDGQPCPDVKRTFLLKRHFADQILTGKKTHEGRIVKKSYKLAEGDFIAFSWCSSEVKLVCNVKEILCFENVEDMVKDIGACYLTPDLPEWQQCCDASSFFLNSFDNFCRVLNNFSH